MKLRMYLTVLIISTLTISTTRISAMSYIKKYNPFAKKEEMATVHREYIVKPNTMITIKNTNGHITCTTWNQDKVSLTATKRAPSIELLDSIAIQDVITSSHLNITTVSKQPNTAIDYSLMIPAHVSVTISNENGDTKIAGQLHGTACLTTNQGTHQIEQADNTVISTILKYGHTTIQTARSNVKASTVRGDITIGNAYASVLANSDSGSINVKSAIVPATSKIKLATNAGMINLQLPDEVNADLKANTKRGNVICQHMIKVKPRTTTLDSKAWKQFREQVDGILGTGEATIVINTNKGNIKILNTKTV